MALCYATTIKKIGCGRSKRREASCNLSVARLKYNSVDLDRRPNPEVRPSGKACSSRTVRETEKSILDF